MDFLNKIPDWLGAGLLAALTGAIGWYAPRHWFPGGSPTTPQQGQSPADDAQRLLHSLQIALDLSPGSYVVNESTDHNAVTANRLFTNAHGEIIGTCFFENPDYGANDYARFISNAARYTRITRAEVCDEETASRVGDRLRSYSSAGTMIVIPRGADMTLISGVFCRLPDRSHLAFISLVGAGANGNRGLVFCGSVAKELFGYYERCATMAERDATT